MKIFLIGILAIFLVGTTVYPKLDSTSENTIRIAFMNRFIQATKLSIPELEKIKENEEFLKQKVLIEVEKYLEKVNQMN